MMDNNLKLKYTPYKIFHYKEKLDSLVINSENVMPPLHIRIKPINACNHNCWYCAYRKKDMQLGKDMLMKDVIPKEKMFELVEDFAEMGVKALTFSGGGEPFIYPYFTETINKVIEKKIDFASLTNGALLSGEIAELFRKHGTWLRISMDGWDDKSYIDYRGVKDGEYTKILKNIDNFSSINGKCLLGISIIVDNKNYIHLYDAVKRLKEAGAGSVKISPAIVSNSSAENNHYHDPIFDKTREITEKVVADFSDENFEVYDSYHRMDINFEKSYKWCPYLQVLSVIGADLNVYSCQDKAYNLDSGLIGSIKDIRFKDFWMNGKEKFFKIDPSKECNHHCVSDGKNKIVLGYLDADPEHMSFV